MLIGVAAVLFLPPILILSTLMGLFGTLSRLVLMCVANPAQFSSELCTVLPSVHNFVASAVTLAAIAWEQHVSFHLSRTV